MDQENKTKQAVAVFDKHAHYYQERFMDTSFYWDTFDVFCENIIPAAAEILEVACGPGNITKYILDKHPDYKITATDLAQYD